MKSKERLLAAIRREPVDRVPANIYYYMQAFYDAHLRDEAPEDAFEAQLQSQLRFGFDPLIGLGGGRGLPWKDSDPGRWESRAQSVGAPDEHCVRYEIDTPAGRLTTEWGEPPGQSGWDIEPLLAEGQEESVAALAYLPRPDVDVEAIDHDWAQMGDRGLGWLSVYGIWQQACYIRGMETMAADPYLRPDFTRRFLEYLTDYLEAQVEALCATQVETVYINESYVGMGISPKVFNEFIAPYDRRLVDAAKRHGKLVLYHDCGKMDALVEGFADLGIDYLEPITPRNASGDVEPADVKRRIGDRVCLRGGFNHDLLTRGTPDEVRAEVRHCLENLAPCGGYMLCPSSSVTPDTRWENLLAYAEAAAEFCGDYGSAS